jgi:hypothetical protein
MTNNNDDLKLQFFEADQIYRFVKEVRQEWGQMWDLCGPKVRIALIDQHCLKIAFTLMGQQVDKAVVREMRSAMLMLASLSDE